MLLFFLASAAMAATYSVTATYEGSSLYYAIYDTTNGEWYESEGKTCFDASKISFKLSSSKLGNYELNFYTDEDCQTLLSGSGIPMKELFPSSQQAKITVAADGSWSFTNGSTPSNPTEPTDPVNPTDPVGGDDPKPGEQDPQETSAGGMKVVAFLTPWSNTNAVMFMDEDSTMMPALEDYCGWFYAVVNAPAKNFNVYFKQTIGANYVGSEGLTEKEPTIATEISLDSVAALSDTIWVKGNQEGAPEVYTAHPAGVLGECPLKKLPVMMFDWLHGDLGNGENGNGNPQYGVSADFGSGGCSGSPMKGMVAEYLGENGLPVSADPFPSKCKITEHLDSWFIPESLAVDSKGNTLTNMTCRDLYIAMDEEGFWLAEVSKDSIFPDSNKAINKGGMFLLDDFKYLDSTEKILNPYYDQLTGGSDNKKHNFGFTMKVQATFKYVPGQYFDFLGDDDVWVFINNRLVVDIGGQHAQVSGAVDLDTLDLIPDSTYNFHIFYAERHTSSSNFRMHTSIDLKTEASIVLRNVSESSDIIEREVLQRVRKNKLACDFSSAEQDVVLESGASVFTLYGGNLPSTGIEMDTAGVWFGGITIGEGFDSFKVDKQAIMDNRGLSPGVYHIRVTLRSDNSQHKDVYFVVGAYSLPTLTFADSTGKLLGSTVQSDTLPISMNRKDTMWVGQIYKVYIQYAEDWAKDNDMIYPETDAKEMVVCDSLGNPITEVQLDSGKATFYVKAVGEIWGANLIVKGLSSANTAYWKGINFAVPPVPQIETAYIYDRDGDGRADSVWIQFNGELGGKNSLDSARITFGKEAFNATFIPTYTSGNREAAVFTKKNGFGSTIFTGGDDKPYTSGRINVWFTYTDNGHTSIFPAEGSLVDSVGPVIYAAEISYKSDGNAQLVLTFSEGISEEDASSDMFRFHCWKNGVMDSIVKNASDIAVESAKQWMLIFPKGADTDIVPAVGDSVRFMPPSQNGMARDLAGVAPHEKNAWIRITGEQKVTITSPGVVTLNPESDAFDSAKAIIQSEDATVPKLITDPTVLTAEQAAAAYGTQGHFLGDLNMAELVENEIADIMKSVQGNPIYTNDDGEQYTIEEIIAAVENGTMTIKEAKKEFGLDQVIVDAYENGILTASNVDKFARATDTDDAEMQRIIESVAENTELSYKSTYYTSLGEFVNSNSGTISCGSDLFKENGRGTCLDNNGKLFLAWNMRAKNGRLASTGVYIARLEYRIKVSNKTMVDRTQDFLWGVRRGKTNALDLELK